jgi:hypothetical protein
MRNDRVIMNYKLIISLKGPGKQSRQFLSWDYTMVGDPKYSYVTIFYHRIIKFQLSKISQNCMTDFHLEDTWFEFYLGAGILYGSVSPSK